MTKWPNADLTPKNNTQVEDAGLTWRWLAEGEDLWHLAFGYLSESEGSS